MKNEFIEYLKSIGLTEPIIGRIEHIYQFYKEISSDEIRDIFVTEYIKADGSREYENLWFFSSKCCMEAKLFITKDDFDMAPMRNDVVYLDIRKQDYDFKKATEKSRIELRFRLSEVHGILKASKENCDHLKRILLEYILPNLKE